MTLMQKLLSVLVALVLLIVGVRGWILPIAEEEVIPLLSGGVTNLTSLTLSTDLDVAGTAELDGGLTVDDTAFSVADATGNTVVGGTLDVKGNVSDSAGDFTIADNVLITPTAATTTTVGAIIRGHSNSSVNVLEVQNYGQTKSFQVSQGGHITTTRTISVGTSASVANGLTVSAGSVSLPAGSVANAALAAGNSYFAIPVHWATQITNTTEEIYRTSIPVAATPISITLSAGAAGGHAAGTARVRVWDDGVSLGEVLETAPSADTYYSHAAALGGSIAANSTLTFEVMTTNYGLTDAQVTLWAYAAHQ